MIIKCSIYKIQLGRSVGSLEGWPVCINFIIFSNIVLGHEGLLGDLVLNYIALVYVSRNAHLDLYGYLRVT
jgi:hypothetical protein